MMKNKLLRLFALVTALLICLSAVCIGAAAADDRYTNDDNGFRVVIIDELDLLTDGEEQRLVEEMQPITEYGNVAFWTTDEGSYDEINQARLKRKELFGFDSATLFMIDMNSRKLTIQSYGEIEKTVNSSPARSITNNAAHYATSKEYYECAAEVYQEIYTLLEGNHIPEPMKITSFFIISVMAGLVFAVIWALSSRHKLQKGINAPTLRPMGIGTLTSDKISLEHVRTDSRVVERSSSGGSSCSSSKVDRNTIEEVRREMKRLSSEVIALSCKDGLCTGFEQTDYFTLCFLKDGAVLETSYICGCYGSIGVS